MDSIAIDLLHLVGRTIVQFITLGAIMFFFSVLSACRRVIQLWTRRVRCLACAHLQLRELLTCLLEGSRCLLIFSTHWWDLN